MDVSNLRRSDRIGPILLSSKKFRYLVIPSNSWDILTFVNDFRFTCEIYLKNELILSTLFFTVSRVGTKSEIEILPPAKIQNLKKLPPGNLKTFFFDSWLFWKSLSFRSVKNSKSIVCDFPHHHRGITTNALFLLVFRPYIALLTSSTLFLL